MNCTDDIARNAPPRVRPRTAGIVGVPHARSIGYDGGRSMPGAIPLENLCFRQCSRW